MTHFRSRLFVLAGLLALLAVAPVLSATETVEPGELLFTPEPIEMGTCIYCDTGYTTSPGGGAASHWGKGSSCSTAAQDLRSQLYSAAHSVCQAGGGFPSGSCEINVIETASCWYSSQYQQYVVDGYANFGCLEGDYFCPEEPEW